MRNVSKEDSRKTKRIKFKTEYNFYKEVYRIQEPTDKYKFSLREFTTNFRDSDRKDDQLEW